MYNPDGKEIIARDNEVSILRKEDEGKAYFHCHTDITIPYDELGLIEECSLQEVGVLGDILSKYILKGEVKGAYWSEGVKNGVFLAILLKLKELLEIKKPLA